MQHIKFGRGNFNKQFHMLLFPYGRFPEIQPLTCMNDLRRLSARLTTNLLIRAAAGQAFAHHAWIRLTFDDAPCLYPFLKKEIPLSLGILSQASLL